jgi:pimeloyl-ACP methyl ester carboxylesterase
MPAYPNPVIFVPGIKGSALRDEYPVDPETVWSIMRAIFKSYDRITLHPYNTRYEAQEPARVARDQVFGLFYSEIIEELRHNLTMNPDEPVPVFPFPYDWRQPLEITQQQLGAFVEEVVERTSLLRHYNEAGYNKETGKVNLVGHSMGGLIIAGHLAQAGLSRVDRVATIASPFRGSLEAVAMTTIGTGSLGFGGSREREAARVTPALYHLLPSFSGAVKNAAPDSLFHDDNWQTSIFETMDLFIQRNRLPNDPPLTAKALLAAMLAQANAQRASMEGLKLPDSKRWLCIAGVDAETRVGMSIQDEGAGVIRFILDEAVNGFGNEKTPRKKRIQTGDGTVPYLGSQSRFIPDNQTICVTPKDYEFFEIKDKLLDNIGLHANLPNMNLVQRLVISHLLQKKQGDLGGQPGPDISRAEWDPPIQKDWL